MGDGTEFTISIPVSGGSAAESAAQSVARLAKSLESAEGAAAAAAAAVKTGEAAYKQAEASADRAAKAVEKLGISADEQRSKLAKLAAGNASGVVDVAAYRKAAETLENLTSSQARAAAKAAEMKSALATEAAALDKLKLSATKAGQAEGAASKALDKAKLDTGTGKVNEMSEAFGKLGGPLGAMGQKAFGAADGMKKLASSLGQSGGIYAALAIAAAAIVAGIVAVGAAAVAATVQIGVWAVGLADAARSSALLSQGIARTVKGGAELDAKIRDLNSKLPFTSAELLQMAGPLADAGLRGKQLGDALQTAAVKAAKLKFGPDFQKEMLSLPFQTARLQSSFSKLFSGLKIEKLLGALERMVDLFDEQSATGKAIKVVFESMFQPLIDGVTAFIPKMVTAFIQFEILVLKALIAIKPWGSKLLLVAEAFGVVAAVITGVLLLALGLIVVSLGALAFGLGVVVGFVTALVAGVVWLGSQFTALGAAIVGGVQPAFAWLKGAAQGALDWLSSLSLAEIGANMIKGLVDGLLRGGPQVLGAITGIAGGAVDAAKKALGIASPSKVFAEIGGYTAEGMADGVDSGAGGVQSSMESMVAPPAASAGPTSVSSTGPTINITVNATGGGESIATAVVDAVHGYFAGMLAQSGGAEPT